LANLPSLPHLRIVAAMERAGFRVLRQGKHVVMTNGQTMVTIPRHNPVNRWTLAGILKDAGISVEDFKKLC
jgi:predicted RNA binding protein YcfA (HicA-like mRNA interferase family)